MNRGKQAAVLAKLVRKYARKQARNNPENSATVVAALRGVVAVMTENSEQGAATAAPSDDSDQPK